MQAVLFDLDGTLMDPTLRARRRSRPTCPTPVAGEWQRLEALHYDAYAAGRISFTEQRRRRVAASTPR